MANPAQATTQQATPAPSLERRDAPVQRCILVSSLCILLIGALATYFCWPELGLSALGISGGALVLSIALFACARSQRGAQWQRHDPPVQTVPASQTTVVDVKEAKSREFEEARAKNDAAQDAEVERLYRYINKEITRGEQSSKYNLLKVSLNFERTVALFVRIRKETPNFYGALYYDSGVWRLRTEPVGETFSQQLDWSLISDEERQADDEEIERLKPLIEQQWAMADKPYACRVAFSRDKGVTWLVVMEELTAHFKKQDPNFRAKIDYSDNTIVFERREKEYHGCLQY